MKSHAWFAFAVLALVACDKSNSGSSAAGSASTTAAIASTMASTSATVAATASTPDPTAGGFQPTQDEWFALQQKMMGAYDKFDTCAKLATNLDKWNADNKAYLTKFRAWAKTNPERTKTFKQAAYDAHKADMTSWPAKIGPAQKCQTDAKVGAALKAINEE
jgi:hypothetical protein